MPSVSTSTSGATWARPVPVWSLRIVDHSRGEDGRPRARLLDLVPDRTGAAYGDWLTEQGTAFTSGIRTATLDPFHGYANAIRDELPEAITVLDAFHVVKLGGQVVDEVRRRVQLRRPGPPRKGRRPLVRDPPDSADRGRTPHRAADPQAQRETRGWGPASRGDPGLALLPEAARRLPRPPRGRAPARGRDPRRLPVLPDPKRSPAWAAPCGDGGRRSWPTSTPPAPRTDPRRRSTA